MNSKNIMGYGVAAIIALAAFVPGIGAVSARTDSLNHSVAFYERTASREHRTVIREHAVSRNQGMAAYARAVVLDHRMATYARAFVGRTRYVWGGDSPATGFDCSGLTHWVYRHFGRLIPRTAEEQYLAFHRIAWARARPGDLVFFHYGPWVYHVGVYEGRGRVVAAADEEEGIRYERIWTREVSFGTITH
jgi:cell wall-associated NlpC family hydrolase